jgi:hypothetical protein
MYFYQQESNIAEEVRLPQSVSNKIISNKKEYDKQKKINCSFIIVISSNFLFVDGVTKCYLKLKCIYTIVKLKI